MSKHKNSTAGFTLVELIIYLAITGLTVSSLVLFAITISRTKDKNYVIHEVNSNMRIALEMLEQKIKAATSTNIGASTFGSDPGVLSLAMADSNKNPTVFSLTNNDGNLQIKEGSSSTIRITSDEVKVTNFVLTNLTASSTRENVRIQLTVEYSTSNTDDNIYKYALQATSTVSVRQ